MKIKITKIGILLAFLFLVCSKAEAQQAAGIPHIFSVSTTTPPALPGGAINYAIPAALNDEWDTLIAPGAWSFNFAGIAYTKFCFSTNGWLALVPGSVPPTTLLLPPNPTNQLNNNTTGYPIIAPLWDDMSCNLLSYVISPANVLWVRWNVKWNKTHAAVASPLFYVKLDGNNNTITYYYANNTAYVPASPSASIGIAGVCTGDFYSVYSSASNAATVDSVTENTTIGPTAGPPPNFRPYNCSYTFTPNFSNDNCVNATDLGTINPTCTFKTFTTGGYTTSGSAICSTTDVKDAWFKFIKPGGAQSVTVTTAPATCQNVGTTIEVFDACGGTSLGCATTSVANPNYGELVLTRPCAAETLFVRVTSDGDVPGKFQICATSGSGGSGSGIDCSTATPVCSPLPFHLNGLTTQGSVNNYNDSVLCENDWMLGEDYVFSYTPPFTQCVNITIDGTGLNSYPGLFLVDGCPNDTDFSTCTGSSIATSNGDSIMNVTLTGGHTYYIVVDNNSPLSGSSFIPFNFHMTNSVAAAPAYDNCGTAASLGTVLVNANCTWSGAYTTQCSTPSPVGIQSPGCGGFVPSLTNDVWLTFTTNFSGTLLINSQGGPINPVLHGGMALYSGSCGSLFLLACSADSLNTLFMPSLSVPVTNGTVYYLRFWSASGYDPGSFQICFTANCGPINDLPINAIPLTLGTPVMGDNTCSTGLQEMPALGCTHDGANVPNTVWYTVVIPPTGQVAVRICQVSLPDAAVGAFLLPGGPANAATSFTQLACNDDIIFASPMPICGMTGDNDAALTFSGTPGTTAYIEVDGAVAYTGSFWITAIAGNLTSTFPPIPRRDCLSPENLCNNADYIAPNGGIGSSGNICDFSSLVCTGNPSITEVGSFWLQFTVAAGSELGFTITPNDSTTPIANYNFYLWDISSVPNICNVLAATPPIRCNTVVNTGKTGLRNPASGAFSSNVPAVGTTRTYLIVIMNQTSASSDEGAPGTTTGFKLNWDIWSGGVNTGIKTVLLGTSPSAIWQGAVQDTNYQDIVNWKGVGSCPAPLPSCTTDVVINAATDQCWVTGNSFAKNVTINAGGTLRILPGGNLHVCGNFVNNGVLICDPGATITFEGAGVQTISGALTTPNSFANLVINKPIGTAQLLVNIDVTQDFTVMNVNSVFSINGKYMKVGGDFTNYNTTTFIGTGGSTVEFNGTIHQTYTNTAGPDTLNRVKMNKATGKLYLIGTWGNMVIDSVLNLTLGNIKTSSTLEVNVRYAAIAAIINHSMNSYVEGRLRRRIIQFNFGSNDFPVGDSLVPNFASGIGYELINIAFTSSTVIQELLCWFNPWTGAVPNGPAPFNNCGTYSTTYGADPMFDHGYWSFQKSVANFNGNYNITAYNTGYTNNTGTQWSIATANIAAAPLNPASWALLGNCDPTSTATATKRNLINTPAAAVNSFNHLYSVVQSTVVLPIELLYFTSEPKGTGVLCKWETASETNNDYFIVERSDDGLEFKEVGRIRGFGNGVSTEALNYSFTDNDYCDDIRYYRLKQIDIDGNHASSDIVAVDCQLKKSPFTIHPNPAQSNVTITFNETSDCDVVLKFVDFTGRTVLTKKASAVKGFNQLNISIEELLDGVYYLDLHSVSDYSEPTRQVRFIKN